MRPIAVLLGCLLVGCCAAPKPAELRLPQFPFDALQGPYVRSAKLYIDNTGVVIKTAVHVEPEALPRWVFQEADARLGAGEELGFEIEQYRGGDRVFEVTRRVDGRRVELALRADRSFKYIERAIPLATAPGVVRATAEAVEGFVAERAAHKKGPGIEYYVIEGRRQGKGYTVRVDPAGRLLSKRKIIQARLEVQPFH